MEVMPLISDFPLLVRLALFLVGVLSLSVCVFCFSIGVLSLYSPWQVCSYSRLCVVFFIPTLLGLSLSDFFFQYVFSHCLLFFITWCVSLESLCSLILFCSCSSLCVVFSVCLCALAQAFVVCSQSVSALFLSLFDYAVNLSPLSVEPLSPFIHKGP